MKFRSRPRGRNVAVSMPRRWIIDALALTRDVPTGGGQRVLRLAPVVEARRALRGAPGWTAIFIKACALVCARRPELRWSYVKWPWPRFYEHPVSICTVISEREWRGEKAVFAGPIVAPEAMGLAEIQYHLDGLRQWPVESIGAYRRLIRFMRIPTPLRRLIMRIGLNVWGPLRAQYLGTYSVNTLALPRFEIGQTMTAVTTSLFHGLPDAEGGVEVYIAFDHRVIDAMTLVRASMELETVLNREIAAELRAMVGQPQWHPRR